MEEQKLLTPLELKVMKIVWSQKKTFVKEIIAEWPDNPAPAYNTVSTIVRILQEKKYVNHHVFGRSHQYYPVVSRVKYQQRLMKNVLDNVFSGSLTGMVSTLLDNKEISREDLDELKQIIEHEVKE